MGRVPPLVCGEARDFTNQLKSDRKERTKTGAYMLVKLQGDKITTYSDANGNTLKGSPSTNQHAKVEFGASNCTLIFGENTSFHGVISFYRDNSTVIIGSRTSVRGRMTLGLESAIHLGDQVYCGPDLQINTAEGATVTLGNDLLIGANCRIRADDSHPIYDGVTGKRINLSQSITIEDHVWLGQQVFVMPGSHIGRGSMIGACSVVTQSKPIPPHSLAVGMPAKVVRSKINWVRKHLQHGRDVTETVPPIFEPEAVMEANGRPRLVGALLNLFR